MIIDGGRVWRTPGGGFYISSTPPDRYVEDGKVYNKRGREVKPKVKTPTIMIGCGSIIKN